MRQARTPWLLRIAAPLAILALALGASVAADQARRNALAAKVEAVPVTLFQPSLPHSLLTHVGAYRSTVTLHYQGGNPTSFPQVVLVAAADRSTCDAIDGLTMPGLNHAACVGDSFDSEESGYHVVALRRGDTVLVAGDRDDGVRADELRTALKDAPPVDAAALIKAAQRP